MSYTQVPRRTFLRGLGTVMALPLLDSMLPMKALAATTGPVGPVTASGLPRRLAFIYIPNGSNMADWNPATVGANYDMPMVLEPLARHRKDFNVLTGLALEKANSNGDGGGDHARASGAYLTGCQPRKTAGANIRAGISADQIAAEKVGQETRLPSLELSCDGGKTAGSCDSGYSCAYQYNLSWRSETMPMNPEVNPRAAFERLFGDPNAAGSKEARERRLMYRKSVLDFVFEDAKSFQRNLGTTDKRKLDEYLTAVREIEQRIERAEKFPAVVPEGVEAPGMFENHPEHVRLMFDVMTLAFQTDSTRVSTFIMAHEGSNRPHPFIGIREGHHDLSHHRNNPENLAKLSQISRYHAEHFAYFLDRLKSIPEGDGNLLDNSMIVYGSGISDPNVHSHYNIPTIVAGGGGGTISTGRHLNLGEKVPITNVYVSLLARMGVETEKVGDSTGTIEKLA